MLQFILSQDLFYFILLHIKPKPYINWSFKVVAVIASCCVYVLCIGLDDMTLELLKFSSKQRCINIPQVTLFSVSCVQPQAVGSVLFFKSPRSEGWPRHGRKNVKSSDTRYWALGPELIPVYRQSIRHYFPPGLHFTFVSVHQMAPPLTEVTDI